MAGRLLFFLGLLGLLLLLDEPRLQDDELPGSTERARVVALLVHDLREVLL